jgi:hypothetical protein
MTGAAAPYVVFISGAVLLAEALRRRTGVPAYVHVIALAVGSISALIMWRAGTLHSGFFGNAFALLVPPVAIYYFFFRDAGDSPSHKTSAHPGPKDHDRDRDV